MLFYRLLTEHIAEMLPIVYTQRWAPRSNGTAWNTAARAAPAYRASNGPDQAPSPIKIILLPVSAVPWLHPYHFRKAEELLDEIEATPSISNPTETPLAIRAVALFRDRRGLV